MKHIVALFIMGMAFTSLGFAQIQWGDAVLDKTNSVEKAASHDVFPFGSQIRVTNLVNGKWVVVKVTNRVPDQEKEKVVLKIAKNEAAELGMSETDPTPVFLEMFRGDPGAKSGSTARAEAPDDEANADD